MRYLPRPIGQRWRTWRAHLVYSLTRPLMAATVDSMSPMEDRARPLPLET